MLGASKRGTHSQPIAPSGATSAPVWQSDRNAYSAIGGEGGGGAALGGAAGGGGAGPPAVGRGGGRARRGRRRPRPGGPRRWPSCRPPRAVPAADAGDER